MTEVNDSEQIARLLFYPQMIRDDVLEPSAFPMDELLAKSKNGCSVDRCCLLSDRDELLRDKARENSNPLASREPYGFCVGRSKDVRALREQCGAAQALEIYPDEITVNNPPKPWDHAHALIRKFDDAYTRANLRGTRDRLSKIFSEYIVKF